MIEQEREMRRKGTAEGCPVHSEPIHVRHHFSKRTSQRTRISLCPSSPRPVPNLLDNYHKGNVEPPNIAHFKFQARWLYRKRKYTVVSCAYTLRAFHARSHTLRFGFHRDACNRGWLEQQTETRKKHPKMKPRFDTWKTSYAVLNATLVSL